MSGVTAAEQILLELGITQPSEIDLEAIAASRKAFIRYEPLDRCEAMIVGNKKAIIIVNSRSRPERQRFSVAHEIGHWHHHRGKVL
jgi:Zn-dependent peptidase ImmA (M78 family)